MDDESGEFMERAELVCVGRSEYVCVDLTCNDVWPFVV